MSDTPRTDAATWYCRTPGNPMGASVVCDSFAGGLERELTAANARIAHLQKGCAAQNEEVCQIAGKALGYPWFKDDPKNFPTATDSDGVCVGDHVAESITAELSEKYVKAKERIARLENQLIKFAKDIAEAKP